MNRLKKVLASGAVPHMSRGSAARWAIAASLLATAKLNDVEPFAYLKDVLERLSDGHPMSRLDDLLPWNWASPVARRSLTDVSGMDGYGISVSVHFSHTCLAAHLRLAIPRRSALEQLPADRTPQVASPLLSRTGALNPLRARVIRESNSK